MLMLRFVSYGFRRQTSTTSSSSAVDADSRQLGRLNLRAIQWNGLKWNEIHMDHKLRLSLGIDDRDEAADSLRLNEAFESWIDYKLFERGKHAVASMHDAWWHCDYATTTPIMQCPGTSIILAMCFGLYISWSIPIVLSSRVLVVANHRAQTTKCTSQLIRLCEIVSRTEFNLEMTIAWDSDYVIKLRKQFEVSVRILNLKRFIDCWWS